MLIRGPFKGGTTPNLLVPALTGIPDLVVTPSDLASANHLSVFVESILTHFYQAKLAPCQVTQS